MTEWVLGVESSCDDTGLGLLSEDGELVHVRDQQSHTQTGGVVPQIAAANHLERISPLFDSLLDKAGAKASDLVALGVTEGPGLAGSLAVGVSWTLGLGEALGLPVWGVHHLEAHTHTLLTGGEEAPKEYPLLVLLVSGGHTSLLHWDGTSTPQSVLATLDDAAGEAIDKVARHLGLGFPGGPPLEALAEGGKGVGESFPLPMAGKRGFSFSGIKTAARRRIEGGIKKEELAFEFQEVVVAHLLDQLKGVWEEGNWEGLGLVGGVAANRKLRTKVRIFARERGIPLFWAPISLATDNGAMVAQVVWRMWRGEVSKREVHGVQPRWPLPTYG